MFTKDRENEVYVNGRTQTLQEHCLKLFKNCDRMKYYEIMGVEKGMRAIAE